MILDEEGNAITKKYYINDFPTAEVQQAFEQKIFKKYKPNTTKDDNSSADNCISIHSNDRYP